MDVRRRYCGALLCGAVFWIAGPGAAPSARASPRDQPRGLVVTLRAPAGCPSQAALRDLVAEHMGELGAAMPALRVEIAVRRAGPATWLARMDVRGAAGGQRDLEGATCREVIDAAALVIALAVEDEGHVVGQEVVPLVLEGEPELGAAARPGRGEWRAGAGRREGGLAADRRVADGVDGPGVGAVGGVLAGGASGAVDREARVDAESAADADAADDDFAAESIDSERGQVVATRHTRLAARAGGVGAGGVLPGATAGFDVAVSGWRGRDGVELAASLWPERVARGGGAAAGVRLWAAGLRACRGFALATACGSGELGRMIGHEMGATHRQRGAPWSALSGSLWWRRHLGGAAAIYAGVEGIVPVIRPRFEVEGALVYQAGPVAGRVLLGVELSTP